MNKLLKSRFMVLVFPVIQVIMTILLYNQIPNDMPMQISISGNVNWTMPKIYGAWMFPSISIIVLVYNMYFKPDTSKGMLWFYGGFLFCLHLIAFYISIGR